MSDMMTFPDTWEDFEKSYGFTDNEEVYTNGARLIPSFRVKQWLEHMPSAEKPFKLPEIYVAEGYDTIEDEDGNIGFGVYAPAENQIYVVGDVEDEIRARALLHEVCHWVQAMCGRPFYEDEANEFSDIVYDVLTPVQPDVPDTNVGELISRQKAKDAIDMALDHIDHVPPWVYDKLLNALNEVPSVNPTHPTPSNTLGALDCVEKKNGKVFPVEPISYLDCSNAMLKMWMDNVVTDGEYDRIMDKLNKKHEEDMRGENE